MTKITEAVPVVANAEKSIVKKIYTIQILKLLAYLKEIITLEPLVICYTLAKAMIDPVLKNLELEKACRVNAKFNDTVCFHIISGTYEENNFSDENNIVQSKITEMHSWQLTTANILVIILILILGSFSDRYEIRKPFILFALFGQLLALSGCILCVKFMTQWPLEVQGFLQEIVYSIFGGEKMLLMIIYAYITDISTLKMRTVRMSIIQALWNICFTIGQSISATFLKTLGYMFILLIALTLVAIAILHGILMIKESKKPINNHKTKKMIIDAFNPGHIIKTLKLFSTYTGTCRINIISMLVVQLIYSIVTNGELSVMFLFTQAAYAWTVCKFSYFFAMTTITNSLGLFIIVPFFSKRLKLNDLLIIALSYGSKIITNIIVMSIQSPTGLFIGCATGILKTLAVVGIRSQLTKYVSQNDVGKVLSLYAVIDSFGEGVASQIYNNGIYNNTREKFPHAFLILGVVLYLIGIIILIWMYLRRETNPNKEDIQSCCADTATYNAKQENETTLA